MDTFSKLFEYFSNSQNKFSDKLKIFAFVTIGILAVDYSFRFSDTYITNTKISQIEKIESIVRNDSIGKEAKAELLRMENNVIRRQGFWDTLNSLTQSLINSTNPNASQNNPTSPTRSILWHYITSGLFLWLFVAISPLLLLQKNQGANLLLGVVLFDIISVFFALILAYLLALIPVLISPIVNYFINILTSGLIFWLMARFVMRLDNQTSANA